MADAVLGTTIAQLDPCPVPCSVLRYGRNVQIDDFKNNNAVINGSPRANFWSALFQSNLNFRFEFDDSLGRHICRNCNPRPGEHALYVPAGPTGSTGEAYALVALLPNLNQNGYVLLIARTNMESTEEAGEFLISPERYLARLRKVGIDPLGPPRYFEILLKVDAMAGTSEHYILRSLPRVFSRTPWHSADPSDVSWRTG